MEEENNEENANGEPLVDEVSQRRTTQSAAASCLRSRVKRRMKTGRLPLQLMLTRHRLFGFKSSFFLASLIDLYSPSRDATPGTKRALLAGACGARNRKKGMKKIEKSGRPKERDGRRIVRMRDNSLGADFGTTSALCPTASPGREARPHSVTGRNGDNRIVSLHRHFFFWRKLINTRPTEKYLLVAPLRLPRPRASSSRMPLRH